MAQQELRGADEALPAGDGRLPAEGAKDEDFHVNDVVIGIGTRMIIGIIVNSNSKREAGASKGLCLRLYLLGDLLLRELR